MRRALLSVGTAAATACAAAVVGVGGATPALAANGCVADPAGDAGGLNDEPETARTARADILEVCLDTSVEGLAFSLAPAEPVDPRTDPAWTGERGAVVHFQVDVDGDGGYDETFFYRATGGDVVVQQASQGGCTGTGTYEDGRYVAQLATGCLGRPATVRVAAFLTYPEDSADPGSPNWYDFTELSEPVVTGYDVVVRRLAGLDRYATAAAIARATSADGGHPVVARGDAFPDALAAANLARPVLLTPFAELPLATAAVVRDWRPLSVTVLGATDVVSVRVEQQLRELGTTTSRTAGRDRYQTAAQAYYSAYNLESKVPREVDGLRTAFLASGVDYADAMTAGPVAAAESLPLLLTAPGALPAATRAALEHDGGADTGIEQVVLVGGPAAVSEEVARQVEQLGIQVRRVAGLDRQATAVSVFGFAEREFGWTLEHVNLARGDGFADAVAGGAHAAAERGPILLTVSADDLGTATRELLRSRSGTVASMDVLGSAAAVSDAVVADARAAAVR